MNGGRGGGGLPGPSENKRGAKGKERNPGARSKKKNGKEGNKHVDKSKYAN